MFERTSKNWEPSATGLKLTPFQIWWNRHFLGTCVRLTISGAVTDCGHVRCAWWTPQQGHDSNIQQNTKSIEQCSHFHDFPSNRNARTFRCFSVTPMLNQKSAEHRRTYCLLVYIFHNLPNTAKLHTASSQQFVKSKLESANSIAIHYLLLLEAKMHSVSSGKFVRLKNATFLGPLPLSCTSLRKYCSGECSPMSLCRPLCLRRGLAVPP